MKNKLLTMCKEALRWVGAKRQAQVSGKRLRVLETAQLGEKRFVAVIRVDKQQFLIGGGAAGVALLASLDSSAEQEPIAVNGASFADVLQSRIARYQEQVH